MGEAVMPSTIAEKARRAQYENIIRKLKKGRVATAAEMAIIEDYTAETDQAKPTDGRTTESKAGSWEFPTASLATFFGVSTKTIREWAKEGLPRCRYGWFNIHQAFEWWKENKAETGGKKARSEQLLCALRKEKVKMARLNRLARQGELLPRDEVERQFATRAVEFARGVMAMCRRVSAKVAAKSKKTVREVERVFEREARELLESYTRPIEVKEGK